MAMEEGETVSENLLEFAPADLRKAVTSPDEVDVASHSSRESSAAVAGFFVATSYKYLFIRKVE
jgi:hypothetical protein